MQQRDRGRQIARPPPDVAGLPAFGRVAGYRLGAEALRDAELIAVLFRTGTRETNAVALAEREMGLDPKELFLRIGLFGGEPWEEGMRTDFEEGFLINAIFV